MKIANSEPPCMWQLIHFVTNKTIPKIIVCLNLHSVAKFSSIMKMAYLFSEWLPGTLKQYNYYVHLLKLYHWRLGWCMMDTAETASAVSVKNILNVIVCTNQIFFITVKCFLLGKNL